MKTEAKKRKRINKCIYRIDELKLWLDHANSMFKYHDDREEINHKLHQAIIEFLRQFDSDCKEMEDRDPRQMP